MHRLHELLVHLQSTPSCLCLACIQIHCILPNSHRSCTVVWLYLVLSPATKQPRRKDTQYVCTSDSGTPCTAATPLSLSSLILPIGEFSTMITYTNPGSLTDLHVSSSLASSAKSIQDNMSLLNKTCLNFNSSAAKLRLGQKYIRRLHELSAYSVAVCMMLYVVPTAQQFDRCARVLKLPIVDSVICMASIHLDGPTTKKPKMMFQPESLEDTVIDFICKSNPVDLNLCDIYQRLGESTTKTSFWCLVGPQWYCKHLHDQMCGGEHALTGTHQTWFYYGVPNVDRLPKHLQRSKLV